MKYTTLTGDLHTLKTPCLVTGLKQARRVAGALGARMLFEAAIRDFKDQPSRILMVQLPAASPIARLMVAGGADGDLSPAQFRKIAEAAVDERPRGAVHHEQARGVPRVGRRLRDQLGRQRVVEVGEIHDRQVYMPRPRDDGALSRSCCRAAPGDPARGE